MRLLSLLVLWSLVATAHAQESTTEEAIYLPHGIMASHVIQRPAAAVWGLISDWNNLGRIAPGGVKRTVMTGSGPTATWVISTQTGLDVPERMVSYNATLQSMTYTMIDPPLPLRNYVGTINVDPVSETACVVHFTLNFEATSDKRAGLMTAFRDFQEAYFTGIITVLSE